jgi:cytochrome c-type biogenesis protein CcmF
LGFAGNAFDRGETLPLHPGQEAAPASLAPYRVHMNALTVTEDRQKQMITADITVTYDGKPFSRMYPAKHFYFGKEGEPTTEVALRRGVAEDLHVVLAGYEVGSQEAQLQVKINPLVNWVWFGVGIMVIGTFIAFLPERAMAFATKTVPENATTTALLLLLA